LSNPLYSPTLPGVGHKIDKCINILQVLAIEFVPLANEFVLFTNEFIQLAIEFVEFVENSSIISFGIPIYTVLWYNVQGSS